MPLNTDFSNKAAVLDHGTLELIDVMGDDFRICEAARVSYASSSRTTSTTDNQLIRYMLENGHTSPFEQVVFTFKAKMPIFVARQWVRHRTARINEMSGRYSELVNEFYVPATDQLKNQSETNKQGRSDECSFDAEDCRKKINEACEQAFATYQDLLSVGMAKEQARIVLPVSTYTKWYWQIDLHNLFNFLRLRMDSHAQYEIRVYADAMYDIVKQYVPVSMDAFDRYIRNAARFDSEELAVLRSLVANVPLSVVDSAISNMMANPSFSSANNRKVKAFIDKIGEKNCGL